MQTIRTTKYKRQKLEIGYILTEALIKGIYNIFRLPLNWVFRRIRRKLRILFFLRPQKLNFSQTELERHTYICGQTGSGKSTLLENLIHAQITHKEQPAVVVLDPHGDLVDKVSRYKSVHDKDRLFLFNPFLSSPEQPYSFATFNPLENNNQDPLHINSQAEQLLGAFREILSSDFTAQMETILVPCLSSLLHHGGRDLRDLIRMLDDDRNGDLKAYAVKHLSDVQSDFLRYEFDKTNYKNTKQGIKTKLQSILNSPVMAHTLLGKSTFDLEALIEERKVICFNLSGGSQGDDTAQVLGRFLLSKLKSIALGRDRKPFDQRTPVHVFLDEASLFVSPSIERILKEARKYRLHLTFATQGIYEGMEPKTADVIATNTNIKLIGRLAAKGIKKAQDETGIEKEAFQSLSVGKYATLISTRTLPAMVVQTPNFDRKKNAPAIEWNEKIREPQLERYYRKPEPRKKHDTNPHATPNTAKEFTRSRKHHTPKIDAGETVFNPFFDREN